MDSTTNSIRSLSTVQSSKAPVLPANFPITTKSAIASATLASMQSSTPTVLEHIEITNVHNQNDCLLRLGDGDCKFSIAKICALFHRFFLQLLLVWKGLFTTYTDDYFVA